MLFAMYTLCNLNDTGGRASTHVRLGKPLETRCFSADGTWGPPSLLGLVGFWHAFNSVYTMYTCLQYLEPITDCNCASARADPLWLVKHCQTSPFIHSVQC